MSYISDELTKRNIPDVLTFANGKKLTDKAEWEKRRLEMVELIASNMFGHIPPASPIETEQLYYSEMVMGQMTLYTRFLLKVNTPNGQVSFPVHQFLPKNKTNIPLFIHIAFAPEAPWRSTPVEMLIEKGYGLLMFHYNEATSDNGDFDNGIAKAFPRDKFDASKISLWAWAMSRVMDYAQTLDVIDKSKIAAIGHSRLGKTSLWCSANDTRFSLVCSNNAGCSGDAITRQKQGETLEKIYNQFPHWFVPKYAEYINREDELPFDQNFLVASSAPRKVCVGASLLDKWADPMSEFLTCASASCAYEFLGLKGFIAKDKQPEPNDIFHDGDIGYHLNWYGHLLGMHDWEKYIAYMDKM